MHRYFYKSIVSYKNQIIDFGFLPKSVVVLLYVFFSFSVYAVDDISIRNIGVGDGLPNANIADIKQDNKGCVWFATKQGLSRYDGTRFTNYETANSGISGNELNTLHMDPDGTGIWIGTERDGLNFFSFKERKFRNFTIDHSSPDSIHSSGITDIADSKNNGVWIATYGAGVEFYEKETQKFSHYNSRTVEGMSDNPVWSIKEDRRGFLYIGYLSEGFSVLSLRDNKIRNFKKNEIEELGPCSNEIVKVYIDPRDNVWLATMFGLCLYNPNTGKFRTFRHDPDDETSILTDRIYDFAFKNNSLWITCRMGGVSVLDLSQDIYDTSRKIRFNNIKAGKEDNNLSSIHTSPILADRFGNIWIGFEGDGIDCITHYSSDFKTIRTKDRNKMALTLCADKGKKIWIGNDAASISVLNDENLETKIKKRLPDYFHDVIFQTIYKDNNDNIWFGTFLHGIIHYDTAKDKISFMNPDPSLPLHIKCFSEDLNGNMWIGTHHGVFFYDRISGKFRHCREINNAAGDNIISEIINDRNGNLWVATFSGGLSCFSSDESHLWRSYSDNRFPSSCINTVFEDNNGDIWAGTRKGLVFIKNRQFDAPDFSNYVVYGEHNGLSNGNIRAINEDIFDNIWVSTNIGISSFIRSYASFNNYYWYDGISRGEYIDRATTIDDHGMIYFGSREGIVYFNPMRFKNSEYKSEVSVSDFIVMGVRNENRARFVDISENTPVELHYDENTIHINYSCKDISYSNAMEYAYQLEGLEELWYNTSDNHVTYRNLPPGKYKFHLKHKMRGNDWDSNIETVDIIVNHPIWLSAYAVAFYCLVALSLVLLLLYLYHRRVKAENRLIIETETHIKDKKVNSERLVFYTNIAHELRTPLTMIIGPVQDMLNEVNDPSLKDRLDIVDRNARRMHDMVNRIMEFRKTETSNRRLMLKYDNPSQDINEIVSYFKGSNNNPSLKINCLTNDSTEIWYDKEVISIILNNIISNAVKYTSEGEVKIISSLEYKNDIRYYTLRISDTGCGISKDNLPNIFERYYQGNGQFQAAGTGIGLALVKNLIDLHKGEISVDSVAGKGTTFEVNLPVDYDYPGEFRSKKSKDVTGNRFTASVGDKNEIIIEEEEAVVKILIVEDNADILSYFSNALSSSYTVICAKDGVEGLHMAFESTPDIIISDIMMPYMDGIELCRIVKNDLRTSHIPVVLLTAKDSPEDKLEGYKNGADSYLTKPVSVTLLKARIENILNRRKLFIEKVAGNTAVNNNVIPADPHSCVEDVTQENVSEESIPQLSELDRLFLEKLNNLIESRMGNTDIDISELASMMNMSHSTLYRKLKALAGCTITVYIQNLRMQKASELLKKGDLTVLEVMYSVGMNTPAYFRKCFKDKFGCLPSEFK